MLLFSELLLISDPEQEKEKRRGKKAGLSLLY
jgi:hypothetical protein